MALRLPPSADARPQPGFDVAWQHVAAELRALGQ
jgi:hypothetical protein